MSAFSLLSKNIQKRVWDMGWEAFTPVQNQTIPAVIQTDKDVIISSGTASGKTEAAFLPILTKIEDTADSQLKALYISPLKALINNQFERIEKLCTYTNIPVYRWHGDVNQSQKKKFIKKPAGILQITPESLESLFINRTGQVKSIFHSLDFIVIDEIHSFLGTERGTHLRSLLSRLEPYCTARPRIVGLSATISNFDFVKRWVNPQSPENVLIIESDGNQKDILYSLMHFSVEEQGKKSLELFEDIYELTEEEQSIIFCNTRGEVEETTVLLNRLAKKNGQEQKYYAHHSSIDKTEREYVEEQMASASVPKSVVCTSTLELGIDIGKLDLVMQIDSTFTVSSLKQRLGRSGRKQDSPHVLQLYTTSANSLLQSTAVMELLLEKWIEPANHYLLPYDILFHQLLSICQETNGITESEIIEQIQRNGAFVHIPIDGIMQLIDFMLEKEMLEKIVGKHEYIVGLEGERILRSKDFYTVFMTPQEYSVHAGMKKIGQLSKNGFFHEGDNIILAGKLWAIKVIDNKKDKIYVEQASNGKPPRFESSGGKVHECIGEKMVELLCSEKNFSYMNETAMDELHDMRKRYQWYDVTPNQRIAWKQKEGIIFEPFTGTVIANTLVWMMRAVLETDSVHIRDRIYRIEINKVCEFKKVIEAMRNKDWKAEDLLPYVKETEFFQSKYSSCLPESLQIDMHIAHEMNIEETKQYLNKFQFRLVE
ncbi:ATP-dependent Lhr-like helicase [Aneurinibacillus soli]|uniref:DEAD-box ATP-dependent RNA helicase CshA n=1 Tax=Aneurinibacillus soli TaxID=1500254 RepID=A0A0U4NK17_9BACL|nr:DEAD/DEAH box helicase [Aneurinibacillus soli]PYE62866.1 ATP-dependent Lhr-like helicase [Aneurinibacillus soli]BAU29076.1 DEAD-box ATP-dependent RNA helicase CshA [Aneurinibacillus soli]